MSGRIAPPWSPRNRRIAARNARLHRLIRAGKLQPTTDKASMRTELGTLAAPPRKPTR